MSFLAKEIKEIKDKLQKQQSTPNSEQEQQLKRELQEKMEKLDAKRTQLRVQLTFKQKSVENVLRVQMPTVLQQIAKKQGLSMIFWERALAYGPAIPDISKDVAQAIDALPAIEEGPAQGAVPKP
jgi:Skp family chaperone for outer membrane proteins